MASGRDWLNEAVRRIEADFNRSADTHLLQVPVPGVAGVTLYLKDESTHPTGSLKHRLARSLFLYGLCNGWIGASTTIIEASSGSTAVSEAYFARLLGLPFIAVMPRSTSPEKIAQIEFFGGRCHLVEDAATVYPVSRELAAASGGHFMDQFTYAERATDWRGNNNIAESIFEQMAQEADPVPHWIVCGAGTGGTSATIGRYLRYRRLATRLCVVDPEHSVFHDVYTRGDAGVTTAAPSRIEGIGRQRAEPSFLPSVIDRMVKVPDAASIGALHYLTTVLGRRCGGSTGTNLIGCIEVIAEMYRASERGSVVSLLCDSGDRYLHTYYDTQWLAASRLDPAPWQARIDGFFRTGAWGE